MACDARADKRFVINFMRRNAPKAQKLELKKRQGLQAKYLYAKEMGYFTKAHKAQCEYASQEEP